MAFYSQIIVFKIKTAVIYFKITAVSFASVILFLYLLSQYLSGTNAVLLLFAVYI